MHSLNVWIVGPEYAPYVALGGIGTGLRGLVGALRRRSHRVTVVIPVTHVVSEKTRNVNDVAWGEIIEENGLRVVFCGIPETDHQHHGYGTDVSQDPRAARRSGLFARAVVELIGRTHQSDPARPEQPRHAAAAARPGRCSVAQSFTRGSPDTQGNRSAVVAGQGKDQPRHRRAGPIWSLAPQRRAQGGH